MNEEIAFDTFSGISEYVHGLIFDSIFSETKGADDEQREAD